MSLGFKRLICRGYYIKGHVNTQDEEECRRGYYIKGHVNTQDEEECRRGYYIKGHVNTQDEEECRRSSLTHDVPLHDITVGVWCALSATRIMRPILFSGGGGIRNEKWTNSRTFLFFN